MEMMMKKLQHKYKKAKDEMGRWDELQSQMTSQFGNVASIIERLQVLREANNYGALAHVPGIEEALLGKQMETLEMIFFSMREIMKAFHGIVISLDKTARDVNGLLKGGSPTAHQMQLRVGIRPSLLDCVEGIRSICDMYQSDADDIASLRQLLVDQPNIPTNEVQSILDKIFAEDIC